MKFVETPIPGVWVVEVEPIEDARGMFARTWCAQEFARHGLNPALVQCNISFNASRGTLRGLHYQAKPHEEAKLVRCTRGAIFDVVVDLRMDSPRRGAWHAVNLTAENRRMLYVPEGCAHGFQTLEPASEVFYQMAAAYEPESAAGVHWRDPDLAIAWPITEPLVSERDARLPRFREIRT